MTDVARSLTDPLEASNALQVITYSAREAIPGIDEVSISISHLGGTVETLAPTSQFVVQADLLQYELGEGPCVEAIKTGGDVDVEDMATDVRWPRYGPRAAKLGIAAQLSLHIQARHHPVAALNLYATQAGRLSDVARQIAELFATEAAVALGFARTVQTLSEAVTTRTAIGTAIGIVMERYDLDNSSAFSLLMRLSQNNNIKLRDIAQQIVEQANQGNRSGLPPLSER